MTEKNMELLSVVSGGIDLHAHSSPSVFARKLTDWELIEQAKSAGFGGIVLKSHETQTADRAQVLQMKNPDFHVFGGIVCNEFVGGLNPAAVDVAVTMGAKIVWMPTFSAAQHIRYFSGRGHGKFFNDSERLYHSKEGISLLNDRGQLKQEVQFILDIVADKDVILATGHISVPELMELSKEVFSRNIKKFLITHADLGIARVPLELQIELAQKGAYMEKCYLACCGGFEDVPLGFLANSVRQITSEQCVLVTDFGQSFNPSPVDAMLDYIQKLINANISQDDIRTMFVNNPRKLLGA